MRFILYLPNDEAIHGGMGSLNSKKDATRRWMSRLVRFLVVGFGEPLA
jgi:hypothetical protein